MINFFFGQKLKLKRLGRLTICIVRLGSLIYQKCGRLAFSFLKKFIACSHQWCGQYMYFCQIFYCKRPVSYNINRSIAIIYCWSLADPPDVPLVHYGKREVLNHISNMEPEFKLILWWMGSSSAEAPGASTQWGRSITISGNPKRITGSRRKSFMADMYGFKTDGELAAVCNYLRTHGGYEIEQVSSLFIRFSIKGGHTLLGLLVGCDRSSDWSLAIYDGLLTYCLRVAYINIRIVS